MPINEIVRMQHRRGILSDLPAQLAEGELGYCLDTRQLFIGNSEGFANNTEILTEFSPYVAPIYVISSMASLRLASSITVPQSICYVEGYSSIADGGEGTFLYNSADTTSVDNGGTIIVDSIGRRWYRQGIAPEEFNILWFGGNTVTNYTPVLLTLIGYINSIATNITGAKIYFPPGKYIFQDQVDWSFPVSAAIFGITICGAGADVTILCFTGGSYSIAAQLTSTHHSMHVRDLSLTTTQNNVSIGLSITQTSPLGVFPQSDVTNVTFRGDTFDSTSESWSVSLAACGVSNIDYIGCLFIGQGTTGTGMYINGNSAVSPYYSIVHNLVGCGFFGGENGIILGAYVQGVTISQTNFTNCVQGIYVTGGSAGDGIGQLAILGCQINCNQHQINVVGGGTGLYVSDTVLFIATGYDGITLSGSGNQVIIRGNSFTGPGAFSPYTPYGTAVNVVGSYSIGVVSGNTFIGLLVGTNLSGGTNWNVNGNVYSNVTTQVIPGTGNSVGVATA